MFRLTLLYLFILACSQVSAEQGSEAIVGGHYAKKGEFKYQVIIDSETHICGGAIIADQYILTAAHCVTNSKRDIDVQRYSVIAGTHNSRSTHDAIVVNVQTVYIPKYYKNFDKQYDIAVLKLNNGLKLSEHKSKIAKINLPKFYGYYDNVDATISGFGEQEVKVRKNSQGKLEEYDGKSDGKLKYANVRVITKEKCQELNEMKLAPSVFCAQALRENKHHFSGICSGDSGGPLVYRDEVIGILSFGPAGCDESKLASGYTKVFPYLHLINSIIRGNPGPDIIWADVPH